jgi:hypothetical protein
MGQKAFEETEGLREDKGLLRGQRAAEGNIVIIAISRFTLEP